jgi:hypothetical protein
MLTRGADWEFRDVILLVKSPKRLKQILALRPETEHLLHYFEEERTAANIVATIETRIVARFEPIAAAWSKAKEKVSLRDWVEGEFILVLANDEAVKSALDAINQVIFKRVSDLLLSQSESESRRSWLFLDEARAAGKLDGLSELLTRGASVGACVVLGFQDIEGLQAVYGPAGEKLANELVGQCANKAIFRLQSPQTAKWASDSVGEHEMYERHDSTTTGGSGNSSTVSWQLVKREAVLPSQFMSLPPTNPENGLTGLYSSPHIGVFWSNLPGEYLECVLRPRRRDVPDFVPRPVQDQYLAPWSDEDSKRLGIPPDEQPRLKVLKKRA